MPFHVQIGAKQNKNGISQNHIGNFNILNSDRIQHAEIKDRSEQYWHDNRKYLCKVYWTYSKMYSCFIRYAI